MQYLYTKLIKIREERKKYSPVLCSKQREALRFHTRLLPACLHSYYQHLPSEWYIRLSKNSYLVHPDPWAGSPWDSLICCPVCVLSSSYHYNDVLRSLSALRPPFLHIHPCLTAFLRVSRLFTVFRASPFSECLEAQTSPVLVNIVCLTFSLSEQ